MSGETGPRLLLLDAADNALVTMTRLAPGAAVHCSGMRIAVWPDRCLRYR